MQGTTPGKGDKSWQEVKNFLVSRRHALEGVVFTGGEPILQKALIGAMQEVRELGFQTALHTAGTAPERLEKILPLVDWVGFDVKTVFEDYQTVTGVQGMGEKARNGLEMLLASGADYEVRTTVDPELIPAEKLIEVAKTISAMGVKTYRLQESSRRKSDYPQQVEKQIASYFGDFDVRRDPLSSVSAA
jgi:pyruvate formate lyase activating enzyme